MLQPSVRCKLTILVPPRSHDNNSISCFVWMWQSFTPFFGAAAFCATKIDNFRTYLTTWSTHSSKRRSLRWTSFKRQIMEVIEVDQQLLREYNDWFSKMLAAGAYSTVSCLFSYWHKVTLRAMWWSWAALTYLLLNLIGLKLPNWTASQYFLLILIKIPPILKLN